MHGQMNCTIRVPYWVEMYRYSYHTNAMHAWHCVRKRSGCANHAPPGWGCCAAIIDRARRRCCSPIKHDSFPAASWRKPRDTCESQGGNSRSIGERIASPGVFPRSCAV